MSKAKTCTTAKCKTKNAKKCPPVKQTVQDVKAKLDPHPSSHK